MCAYHLFVVFLKELLVTSLPRPRFVGQVGENGVCHEKGDETVSILSQPLPRQLVWEIKDSRLLFIVSALPPPLPPFVQLTQPLPSQTGICSPAGLTWLSTGWRSRLPRCQRELRRPQPPCSSSLLWRPPLWPRPGRGSGAAAGPVPLLTVTYFTATVRLLCCARHYSRAPGPHGQSLDCCRCHSRCGGVTYTQEERWQCRSF